MNWNYMQLQSLAKELGYDDANSLANAIEHIRTC